MQNLNKTQHDIIGSPCSDFWEWLPRAYYQGDEGEDRRFTKYNMEVAYLAGKQSLNTAEKQEVNHDYTND